MAHHRLEKLSLLNYGGLSANGLGHQSVIPAYAGMTEEVPQHWIPAYAGMTVTDS